MHISSVWQLCIQHSTALLCLPVAWVLSTAQHSTAQHSTAQHSTAQHSTAQHSTAQLPLLRVLLPVCFLANSIAVSQTVSQPVSQSAFCTSGKIMFDLVLCNQRLRLKRRGLSLRTTDAQAYTYVYIYVLYAAPFVVSCDHCSSSSAGSGGSSRNSNTRYIPRR